MVEIHAYHGWGFNGTFWDKIKSEVPNNILFKAADRGYFGGTFEPEFSDSASMKILFTHSYGLHWCPTEKLMNVDLLVVFNGFNDFLPSEFFERRKEVKILKRMHDQFKKTPEDVLNAFYSNCFYPHEPEFSAPKWINESLLAKDLIALRKTKIEVKNLNLKVVLIADKKDRIVPNDRVDEHITQFGSPEYKIYNEFGHALPIVNSSGCWSYLNEVLPIFGEYADKNGFK